MRRVAIVVQRCHEALVGGAESLAWQYATLLADSYDVEVLTTTASDYVTWANDLPEGEELRDGVTIRRFPVARVSWSGSGCAERPAHRGAAASDSISANKRSRTASRA